jgi:tRNA(adenine34) deaminase
VTSKEADDQAYMRLALSQAQLAWALGEVPVGAVLVHEGGVLAQAHNAPISLHDPTAHAEVLALRMGGQALQNYRLPGATLYVTLEPCAMCLMAMLHARVARIVFAANDPKTGAAGSVIDLARHAQLNHQTTVQGGVLVEEASAMLQAFFRERRQPRRSDQMSS